MSLTDIRSAEHQEVVAGHHTPVTRIGSMDLTSESLQLRGYQFQEAVTGHHTPVVRWRAGEDSAGDYETTHAEYQDAYGVTRTRTVTHASSVECLGCSWPSQMTVTASWNPAPVYYIDYPPDPDFDIWCTGMWSMLTSLYVTAQPIYNPTASCTWSSYTITENYAQDNYGSWWNLHNQTSLSLTDYGGTQTQLLVGCVRNVRLKRVVNMRSFGWYNYGLNAFKDIADWTCNALLSAVEEGVGNFPVWHDPYCSFYLTTRGYADVGITAP